MTKGFQDILFHVARITALDWLVTSGPHTFVISAGAGWEPTGERIAGHLATYPMYYYHDGMPEHGVQPFCRAYSTQVGDEPWCEALDFDPDDPATAAAYDAWRQMSEMAVSILGELLSVAQDIH